MKTTLATITRSLIPLGVLALVGCRHMSHGPVSLSGGPTASVSRAQEADVQIALGRTAERRGDFDQAMIAYREALTRDRTRADAYQRMAVIHDQRGEFRQSAELYRLALAADPGNPDIFCDAGYSLFLQKRWAEAERNLRQAIVLQPDHARAHNNLGMVLARDHRPEDALAEFRKAGNGETEARINLAVAFTLDGRWDDALAQYRQAQLADPASPILRDRIREMSLTMTKFPPRDGARRDPGVLPASVTGPAASGRR